MNMKTIVYRGGVLEFRVPASWEEEYSDMDGGMFYEDTQNSGTLRVKVISLEVPPEKASLPASAMLEPMLQGLGLPAAPVHCVGDNAFVRHDELTSEHGIGLRIFYWTFANPVDLHHARIVTFSYCVLDLPGNSDELLIELKMLDAEILKTKFSAQWGD